ncbi:MAG: efflux RND transporter periplasmic adaptor subunit [candidate division NC10 bacterium]|nr:efflux RND transporter periplasmic adaptor subunit [candidate division NC10 bacterium]MBI4391044.1 efflux RND transporter periplasmic adaptor subunit [candidate division NC10 bacterium]
MDRRRLRRIVKRFLLAGGLVALAGGGALFLLRPAPVTVAPVALREIAPVVQGVGTVEAKVVVQVGAKITGRVVAVLADQGDTVQPGQVLARLDDAEYVAQVEQADASLQRARMALAAQEAAFEKARAALAAAEAAVSRVRATEALARINAERWRQLYAEGGVARADMDARVTEAAAAADELKSAEAQRRVASAEVEVLGAGLEMAHHDIRGAEAALVATRARLADTVIRSPLAGYVVSRELEPGATVNPGTPILKIADPRTAWVTVHVDERETGGIAVEDSAEIALRSLPGQTLPGRVARIQRESDRVTEQLAVDITFEERPPRLILGEQAEATIRSGSTRRVVALPLAALVRTPDGPGAWAVVDGRLHFRAARLGVADPAGWIEVVEGLRPGEQVVVAPGRLADPANEGRRVVATDRAAITVDAAGRP